MEELINTIIVNEGWLDRVGGRWKKGLTTVHIPGQPKDTRKDLVNKNKSEGIASPQEQAKYGHIVFIFYKKLVQYIKQFQKETGDVWNALNDKNMKNSIALEYLRLKKYTKTLEGLLKELKTVDSKHFISEDMLDETKTTTTFNDVIDYINAPDFEREIDVEVTPRSAPDQEELITSPRSTVSGLISAVEEGKETSHPNLNITAHFAPATHIPYIKISVANNTLKGFKVASGKDYLENIRNDFPEDISKSNISIRQNPNSKQVYYFTIKLLSNTPENGAKGLTRTEYDTCVKTATEIGTAIKSVPELEKTPEEVPDEMNAQEMDEKLAEFALQKLKADWKSHPFDEVNVDVLKNIVTFVLRPRVLVNTTTLEEFYKEVNKTELIEVTESVTPQVSYKTFYEQLLLESTNTRYGVMKKNGAYTISFKIPSITKRDEGSKTGQYRTTYFEKIQKKITELISNMKMNKDILAHVKEKDATSMPQHELMNEMDEFVDNSPYASGLAYSIWFKATLPTPKNGSLSRWKGIGKSSIRLDDKEKIVKITFRYQATYDQGTIMHQSRLLEKAYEKFSDSVNAVNKHNKNRFNLTITPTKQELEKIIKSRFDGYTKKTRSDKYRLYIPITVSFPWNGNDKEYEKFRRTNIFPEKVVSTVQGLFTGLKKIFYNRSRKFQK